MCGSGSRRGKERSSLVVLNKYIQSTQVPTRGGPCGPNMSSPDQIYFPMHPAPPRAWQHHWIKSLHLRSFPLLHTKQPPENDAAPPLPAGARCRCRCPSPDQEGYGEWARVLIDMITDSIQVGFPGARGEKSTEHFTCRALFATGSPESEQRGVAEMYIYVMSPPDTRRRGGAGGKP